MIPEGLEEELTDIQAWATDLAARSVSDTEAEGAQAFTWTRADVHALASSIQAIATMALGMAGAGKQLSAHPLLKMFGVGG